MFQKRPWITLLAFTALGFALTQGILFSRWGMNVGLLAAAGVLLWRAWGGGPRYRGAWWWLLPAACYGAAMALWEQPMLSPLLLLGMVMALGLWALDGIHEGGLWEQARPFFPFGEMEAVASGLRRSARAGRLGRVAMGVGLAVPLLIVAGGLLLSADQAFYDFFEGLTNSLADTLTEVVAKAVLSLLIGVYLCCFYLQAEREKTPALRPQREGDPVVLGVMLGLYCGLYLLFLVISCRALPEMLRPGGAPELYSGYARQGFFQLCAAAVLNLAVFLGVRRQRCAGRGADPAGGADPVPYCPGADENAPLYPPVRPDAAAAVYQLHDGGAGGAVPGAAGFPVPALAHAAAGSGAGGLHPGGGGADERREPGGAGQCGPLPGRGFAGNGPDPVYGLPGRGGSSPVPPAGADRGPRAAGGSPDPV